MTRRGRSAPRATRVLGVVVVVAVVSLSASRCPWSAVTPVMPSRAATCQASPTSTTDPVAMTPLQARIVSIAKARWLLHRSFGHLLQ